jgi:radical SAM superfamily enzyme YgiQ (UPF0313 family)
MRVTLIKPNIGRMEDAPYVDEGRMEPLNLGVLAALTPPDVEVKLYDDRMEAIPYDEATDLVGITTETYNARRSYEICAEYRKRGVPVIMGGVHPVLLQEEAAEHADSLFLGDAETMWAQVVEDARRGSLKPVYNGPVGRPQPGVPTRRDLFEGKGYLPLTLVQFSRGCRFNCHFCAVARYFKKQQYYREIPEVIAEIESQPRKLVFFVDDNINSYPELSIRLFRELKALKIHWVSQSTIDMADDPKLMDAMLESGCLGHVVGFESVDPRNLKRMRKASNLPRWERYARQLKVMREYGLQTWASFVLGYDFETPASVKDTADFALDNKFTFAAFNILMPYPDTPVFKQLAAANRLLYGGKWWLHPDYRFNSAAFVPSSCSAEELTQACWEARSRFNSFSSLVYRALDFKTNMRNPVRFATYLQFNPIFRKEVFKKQGMRFGFH